jgi:hypothetical protein
MLLTIGISRRCHYWSEWEWGWMLLTAPPAGSDPQECWLRSCCTNEVIIVKKLFYMFGVLPIIMLATMCKTMAGYSMNSYKLVGVNETDLRFLSHVH